ncbi:MAG TPA: adenylate/guanylate cyclase domain-containing protein [Candidatus Methylacidiphilales bacterium]|jgi:adenylate cyclase|nr:adenylate/guanylate cyclase domain-containing protein [Candidatus Methylacidiphilales bacterium]
MDFGSARPVRFSLLIALVVFVAVGVAWQRGWLQSSEWWIYDHFVVTRSDPNATDPRIILVMQTEHDIDALDFPLRDSELARLLDKIESGGPVVVGLDLYRDLPEPRDKSELPLLEKALAPQNIVAIFISGDKKPFKIPPPASLVADRTRYGLNNFITDGKTVRRGFMSVKLADGKTYNSFPALVGGEYLAAKGVPLGMEGKQIRLGKTVLSRFHGNDGGYVGANDIGYQFLLDFRGPTKFTTLSVSEALALQDTSMFHDKIVMIGSGAQSGNDIDDTPLDPFEAGVLIHAQIINQLLRTAIDGERPTVTASAAFRWFSLAFWCLLGAGVGIFLRSHFVFAAAVLTGSAAIVLTGWWLFLAGYWTLIAAPLAGFLATAIFVKGYAAAHEAEQRSALMKLFSQRLSPEVAQEVWTHRETFLRGARPPAQRLIVTALFTDLKNYSTISEKMTPAELIAWVNQCIGTLAQHVGKNGGFVSTYMGDGMMAVFGVPASLQSEEKFKRDAISAVRCAMNMAAEIKAMNAAWKKDGKPQAGLRVGIYTGEAMTGYIGSDDHLEYSIIGDTINTASRLESVDKEGEWTGVSESRILIGELTHHYTSQIFREQFVGKIQLKGKTETTNVYKVLDSSDAPAENSTVFHENTPRSA